MMKYQSQELSLSPDERKVLNEKVIYLIDSRGTQAAGITGEDIYNAYTGDGGLHGLKRMTSTTTMITVKKRRKLKTGRFSLRRISVSWWPVA